MCTYCTKLIRSKHIPKADVAEWYNVLRGESNVEDIYLGEFHLSRAPHTARPRPGERAGEIRNPTDGLVSYIHIALPRRAPPQPD